jgi:hypothetical protein
MALNYFFFFAVENAIDFCLECFCTQAAGARRRLAIGIAGGAAEKHLGFNAYRETANFTASLRSAWARRAIFGPPASRTPSL